MINIYIKISNTFRILILSSDGDDGIHSLCCLEPNGRDYFNKSSTNSINIDMTSLNRINI